MMNDNSLIFRNSFWLGFGEFIGKASMFFVTVIVVRYLGPKDYGQMNLANSLTVTMGILVNFGFSTIVTRDLSGNLNAASRYLSNIFTLKLLLGLVYLFVLLSISGFYGDSAWKLILLLYGIFFLFQDITSLLAAFFVAEERMEKIFVLDIVHNAGTILAAIFVIQFKLGLRELVAGYVLSGALGTMIAYFILVKCEVRLCLKFETEFFKKILKQSLPLFGSIALGSIYMNADTLMIGKFLGEESVGFYQGAYKILFVFQSVNLICTAVFPRMSVYIKIGNNQSIRMLNWAALGFTALILTPIALMIAILAEPITLWVYGAKMMPSAIVLQWLIWAGVANFLKVYMGNLIIARNRQTYLLYTVAGGLALNIVLNFYLIPRFSFPGAAAALVISELGSVGLLLLFLKIGTRSIHCEL
jgi:O-antigen/teichoic acid export membrane protein